MNSHCSVLLFPLAEVTLKVHVSDASTHQPVPDALIEIFTSQVSIASGTSGADGAAFVKFRYKLGSPLTVTATKHAYVPNSAPWKPVRLPGKTGPAFPEPRAQGPASDGVRPRSPLGSGSGSWGSVLSYARVGSKPWSIPQFRNPHFNEHPQALPTPDTYG